MAILTLPDDVVPASMLVDGVSFVFLLGSRVYKNYFKPFVVAVWLLEDMSACNVGITSQLRRYLICARCNVADSSTTITLV